MQFEETDGYVRIRFSNGVTNTFTTEILQSFCDAVERAKTGRRDILLYGGENFFSNGLDVEWALTQSRSEVHDLFMTLGGALLQLLEYHRPVVGAIRGHAAGAGFAVFLACDYRYAAAGRVLIGKPEVLIGVPNPYYGDQLLRFLAGDKIASDLIYTGRMIEAESPVGRHLVHEIGPMDQIKDMPRDPMLCLLKLTPEAFIESKHMRLGKFCADLREQVSARVARQVEIWCSEAAQSRLHTAAARLRRN